MISLGMSEKAPSRGGEKKHAKEIRREELKEHKPIVSFPQVPLNHSDTY